MTGPSTKHTNVEGTELLIQAARQSGRRAPSCTCRRRRSPTPATRWSAPEPTPPIPARHAATTPPARRWPSSLALDATSDAMPVVAIRPHLVWGPGDTQLVGRIVERARQGRLALVGSGAALIDTTYVDNAADALVAAVDRAAELGGEAFVVSNGEPRTVHELVARIAGGGWCRVVTAPRADRAGAAWRRGRRTDLGPRRAHRRSADDELSRRAALDRPLVRPARDAGGVGMATGGVAGRGLRPSRRLVPIGDVGRGIAHGRGARLWRRSLRSARAACSTSSTR